MFIISEMLDMANNKVKHKQQKIDDNVSMNLQERINHLFDKHPDCFSFHKGQIIFHQVRPLYAGFFMPVVRQLLPHPVNHQSSK